MVLCQNTRMESKGFPCPGSLSLQVHHSFYTLLLLMSPSENERDHFLGLGAACSIGVLVFGPDTMDCAWGVWVGVWLNSYVSLY